MRTLTYLCTCIFFLLLNSGCSTPEHALEKVPGIKAATTPAMLGHNESHIVLAVVADDKNLYAARSFSPGNWTPWEQVASSVSELTAPVLISAGNQYHLFARGKDDRLLHFVHINPLGWSPGEMATQNLRVKGRISVAATTGVPTDTKILHLVFQSAPDTTTYVRIENHLPVLVDSWGGVQESAVGSDDRNLIMIAFRTPAAIEFMYGSGASNWSLQSTGTMPFSESTPARNISELVWFPPNNAFHLAAVSTKPGRDRKSFSESTVHHIQIIPVPGSARTSTVNPFIRTINTHKGRQTNPAQVSLANYRNKLVAAWRSPFDKLRYARWDNADIQSPWIVKQPVDLSTQTKFKPSLAPLDKLLPLFGYQNPNYGNDLFLAVAGDSVRFDNLSRTVSKVMARKAFLVMQMDSFRTCGNPDSPRPAYRLNVPKENRPFISELGFNLWMFPHRFIDGFYPKAAKKICNGSLRDQACSVAKMPVIFKENGGLYFCQGAFVNLDSKAIDIYAELGHYMAIALGWINSSPGPVQADADRSGIPLSELKKGYDIFTERINTCQAGPRCKGFTGYAGNYDNQGREHSFLYAVSFYLDRPEEIRLYIQQDLAQGDNLLLRKYNWIRDNIFRGVEF